MNSELEKRNIERESAEEIERNIRGALELFKEIFKKDKRLGVNISDNLHLKVPHNLRNEDIGRLSEIICEGFETFQLDSNGYGDLPLDSIYRITTTTPMIDTLDSAIELANRLGKEIFLITDEGKNCFAIPSGLSSGIDREDIGSDTLILVDALEKGLEVVRSDNE